MAADASKIKEEIRSIDLAEIGAGINKIINALDYAPGSDGFTHESWSKMRESVNKLLQAFNETQTSASQLEVVEVNNG